MNDLPKRFRCPNCGIVLGTFTRDRLKIRIGSRLVAVDENGRAETNCEQCKKAIDLPLSFYPLTEEKRAP